MKKLTTLIICAIISFGLLGPITAHAQEAKTKPSAPAATAAPSKVDPKTTVQGDGFRSFNLNSIRLGSEKKENKNNPSAIQGGKTYFKPGTKSPITAFILTTIDLAIKVIGSVAFLVLVIAGIWMTVSIGMEQQVTKAKTMFLYSILGLVFAFASYFFVSFLQGLLVEVPTTTTTQNAATPSQKQ